MLNTRSPSRCRTIKTCKQSFSSHACSCRGLLASLPDLLCSYWRVYVWLQLQLSSVPSHAHHAPLLGKVFDEGCWRAGAVDAASLGAELSRAFGTHPFLSTSKGVRAVMRILEVRRSSALPPTSVQRNASQQQLLLFSDPYWHALQLHH